MEDLRVGGAEAGEFGPRGDFGGLGRGCMDGEDSAGGYGVSDDEMPLSLDLYCKDGAQLIDLLEDPGVAHGPEEEVGVVSAFRRRDEIHG